jgi:hypothetical protein
VYKPSTITYPTIAAESGIQMGHDHQACQYETENSNPIPPRIHHDPAAFRKIPEVEVTGIPIAA